MENMSYSEGGFGGVIGLIALLGLLNMGNGGLFGGAGRTATVEDINNSANFTRLDNQVRNNENYIQQGFTNMGNGICNLGYRQLEQFSTLRYDNAIGQKDLATQIHLEGEATRNMIQQDKIESLRSRVSQLELQNAVGNVVRYPTSMSYNAGTSPFCNCGMGCGCANI